MICSRASARLPLSAASAAVSGHAAVPEPQTARSAGVPFLRPSPLRLSLMCKAGRLCLLHDEQAWPSGWRQQRCFRSNSDDDHHCVQRVLLSREPGQRLEGRRERLSLSRSPSHLPFLPLSRGGTTHRDHLQLLGSAGRGPDAAEAHPAYQNTPARRRSAGAPAPSSGNGPAASARRDIQDRTRAGEGSDLSVANIVAST
jgi:hypothetical protein